MTHSVFSKQPADTPAVFAPEIWSIVVAAGTGNRFGGEKQFELIDGRPMIEWSVDVASQCSDGVVLVVSQHRAVEMSSFFSNVEVVAGGDTRAESVRAGLAAIPDSAEVVVVHDAARPFATDDLFRRVIGAVLQEGVAGAVPGLPVVDTIKTFVSRPEGRVVDRSLDRSTLTAVQTPQAFRRDVLVQAHISGLDATDDAALVELVGGVVVLVDGEMQNQKVTYRDDLVRHKGVDRR